MGSGRWDADSWSSTRSAYTSTAKPTVDHIYTSRSLVAELDPKKVKLRESRDSDANPNSTALIIGLDVTGSMGMILDYLAREGLGNLVSQIYDRRPITDPHIMCMGIGDFECDFAPLQVTQFEAENTPLVKQLESIYLERGGGGNSYESYAAAWLFASQRTSIDCFERRGKKGYLFTIGDEQPTPRLTAEMIKRHMGDEQAKDMTSQELLELAAMTYDIFHVVALEGSYARSHADRVMTEWTGLLGQHVIPLADHKKLAEVIVSAIQIAEGADHDAVAKSWSGDTAVVVANATRDIVSKKPGSSGAIKLY